MKKIKEIKTFCKQLMKEQHKRKAKKMVKHLKKAELWVIGGTILLVAGLAYIHIGINKQNGVCFASAMATIIGLGSFVAGRHWKK